MKILPLLVILAQVAFPAQADELDRFINVQPLAHVRLVCAGELVPDWGCVTFGTVTSNPNVVICYIHVPTSMLPWEQDVAIERLRPKCMEQGR